MNQPLLGVAPLPRHANPTDFLQSVEQVDTAFLGYVNKLSDPAKGTKAEKYLQSAQTGLQQSQAIYARAEQILPRIQEGLTGTRLGPRTGLVMMILTGVVLFIPIGITVYNIIKKADSGGDITQLIAQLGGQLLLIGGAVVGKLTSNKMQQQSDLQSIQSGTLTTAQLKQSFLEAADTLDRSVKSGIDEACSVAFKAYRAAWTALPPTEQQRVDVDAVIEKFIRQLPEESNIKFLYDEMLSRGTLLWQLRQRALNEYQLDLIPGSSTILVNLQKLKALNPELENKWKSTQRKFSTYWGLLEDKIGTFECVNAGMPGFRYYKSGRLVMPVGQTMMTVLSAPKVVKQKAKQADTEIQIDDDSDVEDHQGGLVLSPASSSYNPPGRDVVDG